VCTIGADERAWSEKAGRSLNALFRGVTECEREECPGNVSRGNECLGRQYLPEWDISLQRDYAVGRGFG